MVSMGHDAAMEMLEMNGCTHTIYMGYTQLQMMPHTTHRVSVIL